MTANKRIFLNIIATYGRSLYTLALGLMTARWGLQALGKVDYGLIGLVGGLVCFVTFINNLMAGAVGRFYAVNVGAAKRAGNAREGLEECRKWFNVALSIHTAVPLALMIVGYPIGEWAVRHFLTIPADRIISCVWVWRFTCVSCLIGMFNVPFRAMYNAKQEIAELTVYTFFTATFNAVFLYYMVTHPGFWLTKMAAWNCLLAIAPKLIICVRAISKYPECRLVRAYLWDMEKVKEVSKYAFARAISGIAGMLSTQAPSILINKYLGPVFNASMAVGASVASHSMTLSGSISGAFWPAIANKAGEGDEKEVKRLSFMTCRLSTLMVLIFAIPLLLEAHEVLRLWLKNPPDFAAEICIAALLREVIDRSTTGYWMGILGLGRGVMKYSYGVCWAGFIFVAVTWLLFAMGVGLWSICLGFILYGVVIAGSRLYLGAKLIDFRFGCWVYSVALPIFIVTIATLAVGFVVRLLVEASFLRVIYTTITCECVLIPLSWRFVLNPSEREFLMRRIRRRFDKKSKV